MYRFVTLHYLMVDEKNDADIVYSFLENGLDVAKKCIFEFFFIHSILYLCIRVLLLKLQPDYVLSVILH